MVRILTLTIAGMSMLSVSFIFLSPIICTSVVGNDFKIFECVTECIETSNEFEPLYYIRAVSGILQPEHPKSLPEPTRNPTRSSQKYWKSVCDMRFEYFAFWQTMVSISGKTIDLYEFLLATILVILVLCLVKCFLIGLIIIRSARNNELMLHVDTANFNQFGTIHK